MLDKSDLKAIKTIVDTGVKQNLKSGIKHYLKPVKEDITKIRKDVSAILDYFDREYIDLRKRVEGIEDHLQLPQVQ